MQRKPHEKSNSKRAAALLVLTLPIYGIFAAASPEKNVLLSEGDFEYTIENRKATITKYTGNEEQLAIPEKLGGHKVTAIGEKAFMYCQSLTQIEIPNSVISMGEEAF